MDELKAFLKIRKNQTNLLILAIITLLLPLGINLAKNRQIFFSGAAGEKIIELLEGPCVKDRNGKKVLICKDVPLKLISPFRLSPSPSPSQLPFPSQSLSPGSSTSPSSPAPQPSDEEPASSSTPNPSSSPSPLPQACSSSNKTADGKTIVNVRSFNNNIQSALECFKFTGTGGAVYLPAGTYEPPDKIRLYNNVTIFGDGMNKTFIKHIKKNAPLMANDSSRGQQNITIRDLTLQSDGQSPSERCCSGIELANLQGGFINNVKIEKFGFSGILFSYKVKEGTARAVEKVRVSNCFITNNQGPGVNFYMGSNNVIDNCTFEDNSLKQGAGVNIELGAEGMADNNYIINNKISQGGPAINLIGPANDMIVSNNKVCYNTDDTKGGISDNGGRNNIYIGNSTLANACPENTGRVSTDSRTQGYVERLPPATDSRCDVPGQFAIPARPSGPGIAQADNQVSSNPIQASCQNQNNVFGNCGFENDLKQVSAFQCSGLFGNWVSTAQYKPGRMNNYVSTTTSDTHSGDKALVLGTLDRAICSAPKNFNGDHTRGNHSLFSEAFQVFNLKDKNSLNISFWYKMKSEGYPGKQTAPFYVYITSLVSPYPDAWLMQVWPRGSNSCGSGQSVSSFECDAGNCSGNLSNTWTRVSLSYGSSQLNNMGVAGKIGYIGFGVMNDYPTQVLLDDVVVTTNGSSAQGSPQQLYTPVLSSLIKDAYAVGEAPSSVSCFHDSQCPAGQTCNLFHNECVSSTSNPSHPPSQVNSPAPSGHDPLPAGSSNPSSNPSSSASTTTSSNLIVKYRLAETEAGLENVPFTNFTTEPLVTNFSLTDDNPGAKQVWVEFINGQGTPVKDHLNLEFALKDPEISTVDCTLDNIQRQNLKVVVSGQRFDEKEGKIFASNTQMDALEWKDNSITAIFKNPNFITDDAQTFDISLTRTDRQSSPDVPCRIDTSLVTLGAKVFCRDEGMFDVAKVKITLIDPDKNKVDETVAIDKDGVIQGLKTKLQAGKNYVLSLKAPYSLRRNASFTAGSGTTLVSQPDGNPFVLPIGDIAPVNGPDGAINSADKAVLTQQWVTGVQASKNLTGDFNRDQRVNSFDWACMRYDFNNSDDPIPDVTP